MFLQDFGGYIFETTVIIYAVDKIHINADRCPHCTSKLD